VKSNLIFTIQPYKLMGTMWVFDDPEVNLKKEPLIAGADTLCEEMSQGADKFTLMFSEIAFPGHTLHLKLKSIDQVGQTYQTPDGREAWLCPALLLYFTKPPKHLYAQAKVPKRTIKRRLGRWWHKLARHHEPFNFLD